MNPKIKYTRRFYSRYGTISMPLAVLTGAGEMLLHSFWWFFAMKPSGRFGFVALKLQDNWFGETGRIHGKEPQGRRYPRKTIFEALWLRSERIRMDEKAGVIGWYSAGGATRAVVAGAMLASMVDFAASRLDTAYRYRYPCRRRRAHTSWAGVYSMGCPGTSLEVVSYRR